MGISSRARSAAGRVGGARLAEKRAFESYLRHGRVPGLEARPAEAARKLSLRAIPAGRSTTHYTWRTAHDERVRSAHAANEGKVFAWSDPPDTGHPGHGYNCRCWPEPYYGSPGVAEAPLLREARVDTSGSQTWSSIDTAVRVDGSLAESRITLRDGTRVVSTFAGSRVVNDVRLPGGQYLRFNRQDGVQSITLGNARVPILLSAWTPYGPRIALPRTRVAQLASPADMRPSLGSLSRTPYKDFGEVDFLDPTGMGGLLEGIALGTGVAAGILALYNAAQAEPKSMGAGTDDIVVVSVKTWEKGDVRSKGAALVGLSTLTTAEVSKICKRLPDVQEWTDLAVEMSLPKRASMSPQQWGMEVHKNVEGMIKHLKIGNPTAYGDVSAELTISKDGRTENVSRGEKGSTRLDVFEEQEDAICVFDVKTGVEGLTMSRLATIADKVMRRYGTKPFYLIEVRPSK